MAYLNDAANVQKLAVASTAVLPASALSSPATGASPAGLARMTATAARRIRSAECRLLGAALMISR
jgi:hypothetical protein